MITRCILRLFFLQKLPKTRREITWWSLRCHAHMSNSDYFNSKKLKKCIVLINVQCFSTPSSQQGPSKVDNFFNIYSSLEWLFVYFSLSPFPWTHFHATIHLLVCDVYLKLEAFSTAPFSYWWKISGNLTADRREIDVVIETTILEAIKWLRNIV